MVLFWALDSICFIVFISSTCLILSSRKFLISILHSSGFCFIFSLRSRGIRMVYVEDINYHNHTIIMFRKLKTLLRYKSVYKHGRSFIILRFFAQAHQRGNINSTKKNNRLPHKSRKQKSVCCFRHYAPKNFDAIPKSKLLLA